MLKSRFKMIVSLQNDDGTYAEVGMTSRTLFTAKSVPDGNKKAAAWAHFRPRRLEFFANIPGWFTKQPLDTYYCG